MDAAVMDVQEAWRERAIAAEWTARALSYPTEEFVDLLVSGDFCAAGKSLAALSSTGPEALALYEDGDVSAVLRRLRIDYTALFLTAPQALVSPNAGVWHAKDSGANPMLFNGDETNAVESDYRSFGLVSISTEPPDHIATCMEFVEYLCACAGGLADDASGHSAAELGREAHAFASEHLVGWLPRFAAEVNAHAAEPLYRIAANAACRLSESLVG